MYNIDELKNAVKIRSAMNDYQNTVYLNMIRQINEKCSELLGKDLGSEFVRSCGRDLAGEVVRNCFDASNYNITVDQLSKRILEFSYENEYDPLKDNGGAGELSKNVYNYNELFSSDLNKINDIMEQSQSKLFDEDRSHDSLDIKGKKEYREKMTDENGNINDDLTGREGTTTTYYKNNKEVQKSNLQADHIQARESAMYNARYVTTEEGKQKIKEYWNSEDNMQMIEASANSSKGDIRVCLVDNEIKYVNARSKEYDEKTDITYKATPEQLADAVCKQWESVDTSREGQNKNKIQKLKEKGYLDDNNKVPKSVRMELIKNIRRAQNKESIVVLKNTDYKKVAADSLDITKSAIGKIIAGQIIYYAAPPLVYETGIILKDKNINIKNALTKLSDSCKRIGEYVFGKLKDIFVNVVANCLKKFIKSFMDILINLVKATIKKLMKIGKSLVLSTVDAIRIVTDKNATKEQKANSVCNLYSMTITTCVVDVIFTIMQDTLSIYITPTLAKIVFGPLQILATVICTNLVILILREMDLFDVELGFKVSKIRAIFEETKKSYDELISNSTNYAEDEVKKIIEHCRAESYSIYNNLEEFDPKNQSAREDLEKINTMFSMNIDFEHEWLLFLGIAQ